MSYVLQFLTRKEGEFLHTVKISYGKQNIMLTLGLFHDPEYLLLIEYQKVGRETLIVCEDKKKEILVEEKDFVSIFCDDLESILLYRNTQLDKFEIDNGEFWEEEEEYRRENLDPILILIHERLVRILKNRDQKLIVRGLKLQITEENQITSILQYIDPSTLTWFDLSFMTNDTTMNLSEMWSLDFWRLAKPIVNIYVVTLHPEMLIALKEVFFKYSNIDYIVVEFSKFETKQIKELFGEPINDEDWKIPIPNRDEEFLNVNFSDRQIYFHRVCEEQEDSEEGENSGEDEDSEENEPEGGRKFEGHEDSKKDRDSEERGDSEEDGDSEESEDSEEDEESVNGSSTRKRLNEDPLQKLSIEPKKRRQIEHLKTKHSLNVQKVFQNDILLKKIAEYAGFVGIQALRKVSRDIRQCIDRIKPDPAITLYCFDIESFDMVDIDIGTSETSSCYPFPPYKNHGNGCIVRHCQEDERIYIPEDFRMRSLKDFELNIKHLPSGLDTLKFEISRFHHPTNGLDLIRSTTSSFLEAFEEFFRSKTPLLKVKQLKMNTIRKTTTFLQQNEVMKVLPLLDPQVLEIIDFDICYQNEDGTQNLMEVDEISKLSQWMNAKELIMRECIILTPIQEMNITHFAKGDITVQTISLEDLRNLKEGFQNSSTVIKFKIAFKECTFHEFRNDAIYQFMGVPHVEANRLLQNQRNIWFCRTPHDNYVLHILHYVGRSITFSRVEF